MAESSFKIFILILLLVTGVLQVASLRDVRVVLPAVVPAGGVATLLCLFDLESAPLYAVKWYRGTREFYRYVPGNPHPAQVVPFPGIEVDLTASNERQVTLRKVPPYLTGAFTCEVSCDAPSFTTAVAHGELVVTDFPDIKIDSDMYDGGQTLTVNCTYEPLKLPSVLTFYINNEPAPRSAVREWAGGASLRFKPSARDVSAHGELRLRCILVVDGRFPVTSDSVALWLPVRPPSPPLPPPPRMPWDQDGVDNEQLMEPTDALPSHADCLRNALMDHEEICLILACLSLVLLSNGNQY